MDGADPTETLVVERRVPARADDAWRVAGDWRWWAFGAVTLESDGRVRTLASGRIVETLVEHDAAARRLAYVMRSPNPFDVTSYRGEISVLESDGESVVRYAASYTNGGRDAAAARARLEESLALGLQRLALAVAPNEDAGFELRAPLERLAEYLGDFDEVAWLGDVREASLDDNGRRRTIVLTDGTCFCQEWLGASEEGTSFAYEEWDGHANGAVRGRVEIALRSLGSNHTFVTLEAKSAASSSPLARVHARELIARMRDRLESRLSTRDHAPPTPRPWRARFMIARFRVLALSARLVRVAGGLFGRTPTTPALDLADRSALPIASAPDAKARRKRREAAAAVLRVADLYDTTWFRTQRPRAIPKSERFPIWWKALLIGFQVQVRLLLGASANVSQSALRVADARTLEAIWAYLPDDKYNATSFEDDATFIDLFRASTGATLIRAIDCAGDIRWLPASKRLLDSVPRSRVYVADFSLMKALPGALEDVPAPVVAMFVTDDDMLAPLFIELGGITYTPARAGWLDAKMWAAKAYVGMVRTVHHGLLSHFSWAGTFSWATYAELDERHPVRRLIAPFLRYTMQINELATRLIVNEDGALAGQVMGYAGSVELMRRMERRMRYTDIHLPQDLEARGVLKLPGYRYGEVGMSLWNAIRALVRARIEATYASDACVEADAEVNAWARRVSDVVPGFPSPIRERAQLIDGMTSAIYSVVLHQLHNAPAADHTIVPARPASLASTVRGVSLPRFRGDGPAELWRHASLGNVVITLLFDATLTPYNPRLTFAHDLHAYCESASDHDAVSTFERACASTSTLVRGWPESPLRFDHLDPVHSLSQSVCS